MSKRAEAEALSAKLSHRHKELRKCLYDVKSDKDAIREEMSALELLRWALARCKHVLNYGTFNSACVG